MTLVSPNTVLANALTAVEDVLAPRIHSSKAQRIALVVGTQINGGTPALHWCSRWRLPRPPGSATGTASR